MEKSVWLQKVYDHLTSNFKSGWIESLGWSSKVVGKNDRVALNQGLLMITEAQRLLLNYFARFALGGKQFIEDYNVLDDIKEWALVDVVVNSRNKYKTILQRKFQDFLLDIREFVILLRYHIDTTKEQFSIERKNNYLNAVKRIRPVDKQNQYIYLFEVVIEVCLAEYGFSFSEGFIRQLLHWKNFLTDVLNEESGDTKDTIQVSINKIDLMLYKLAFFSKGGEIAYNFNFKHYTISCFDIEKKVKNKFYKEFVKFVNPIKLTKKDIEEFQIDSWQDDIAMWKLVLLMRYYSKVVKNITRIDKVIQIYEHHYQESICQPENVINEYAANSVRNYMHNCRFSFLCQYQKQYTLEQFKIDLDNIETIQAETQIKNYHPYKMGFLYLKRKIEEALNEMKPQNELEDLLDQLKYCYKMFKENVEWCQLYQPYMYQLRFNYCTDTWNGIDVFCPSSYCRPLRFKELSEDINQYANELWSKENRIKQNPDRLKLLNAHKEIDNIGKKNFKLLSYFSTLVIFLVGLISIFFGNTSSMVDKMEYVIVLGTILLLFVCLGYFITCNQLEKYKFGIFFVVAILLIVMLLYHYLFWTPKSLEINKCEPNLEKHIN